MAMATELRARLNQPGMLLAPGSYDGLTARLVEQAGFSAVYMTGAGASAARGYPDFGLITMSEMVESAGRIAQSVGIPLISDADTGYGNELNVFRTVREYERAGVAAIHLEDQEFPKRCGHLDDKRVVSREDYVAKIRAAAAARKDRDFVIIARTDSRAVLGFEEAVHRGNAALEAGADAVFVEAPQTVEELRAIPREIKGPCLLNVVESGKTPAVELSWAEEAGFKIAILPGLLLRHVVATCEEALRILRTTGEPPPPTDNWTPANFFKRLDSDGWSALRTRFREPGEKA
jgi:2-methylisocitrate lyase-like PEP mutase family enzyme